MTHRLATFDVEPGPELGRGASTIVYLGRHRTTGEKIALKVAVDSTDVATTLRLRHEATVLAQLQHPRLVPYIGLLESRHDVALLTSAAAGGSLYGLLGTCGPVTNDRGIDLARQILLGVCHVHARRMVHGDITPANILLPTRREVWLADFDRARTEGDVHAPSAGTPRYVAPEVGSGRSPHAGSDVWSAVGCCVELLTGTVPQDSEQADALLAHQPTAIRAALVRALDAVPDRRPTAAELVNAFAGSTSPDRCPPPSSANKVTPATPTTVGTTATTDETVNTGRNGPSDQRGRTSITSVPPPPTVELPTVELPTVEPKGEHPPTASTRRRQVVRCASVAAATVGFGLVALGGLAAKQTPAETFTGAAILSITPSGASPGSPIGGPCAAVPGGSAPLTRVVNSAAGTSLRFVRVDGQVGSPDCRTPVVWAPATGTLSIDGTGGHPVATYTLGRPGDRLLLGDWNADHLDEPAIYRPSTGMLYRFDGWAGSDAPRSTNSVERTGVLDGSVTVTPGGGNGGGDRNGDRIVVSRERG